MISMSGEIELSAYLQNYHDSGDCGEAFAGLSEEAKKLEDLLLMCCKDLYSPSGTFKKKTGLALFKYVNEHNIEI